ncbi:MAG: small multi-drug export protein [Desulfurococcales archaeon]|nr:small multi-drug export protein [Desulfurococcales archaeon]MCE4604957.1 small multi-drug export protein [Desulfurococcales archaeon]
MASVQVPSWLEGFDPLLAVAVAGIIPGLEPRYAVLLGAYLGLPLAKVVVVASAEAILLSILLSRLLSILDPLLSRAPLVGGLYSRYRSSALRRAGPSIERWGGLGLTIFVAIPLPATGIYTGAIAGLLLGLKPGRMQVYLAAGGLLSIAITLAISIFIG